MEFAKIIIQQLGGIGKLTAMLNARNFTYDGTAQSLTFKFSGCKKASHCKITLMPTDTYKFELIKVGNLRTGKAPIVKTVYETENVYADMLRRLFESETGLYLSI